MSEMEQNLTEMHNMTNSIYTKLSQTKKLITQIEKDHKIDTILSRGNQLVKDMNEWDKEMVQRLNKAYDDVENHPNKFTASYLYLINQTESAIPRINKGSIERRQELDAQWKTLKSKGKDLLENQLPAFNKLLWEYGIGGIWAN